ncbi:pachytene checkpoint protein 2 homolog [Crocuta crocuta]
MFQLNKGGPSSETLEEETENIMAASHWVLPAAPRRCDDNLTAFRQECIDSSLITWNRVVLPHARAILKCPLPEKPLQLTLL